MKSNRELISLIIGLGKTVYAMGQIIFCLGLISYWFIDPIFSIYLMLVGIGMVFLTGQKVKNIHLIGIIRKRSRKRKDLLKQEDGESDL